MYYREKRLTPLGKKVIYFQIGTDKAPFPNTVQIPE
jgi:hypothetical protein